MKSILSKIVVAAIIIAVVAAAAVIVAAFIRGGGTPDFSFDIFTKTRTSKSESEFFFESGRNRRFAAVGDNLAVSSSTGLDVFDTKGSEILKKTALFDSPAIDTDGNYGIAYDIGGSTVIAFSATDILWSVTTDHAVVSCNADAGGLFTVITGEDVYKTSSTVYNAEGKAIYIWYSGEGYAIASDFFGNDILCCASIGHGGSKAVFYSTETENELSSGEMSGVTALDVKATGDTSATILASDGVYDVRDGAGTEVFDFGGATLGDFSLGGEDFSVYYLLDYLVGSTGKLVTVSDSGEFLGSLDFTDKIESISAAGDYIAVHYGTKIVIFDSGLIELCTLTTEDPGDNVIMREDGSVIFIDSSRAVLYNTGR